MATLTVRNLDEDTKRALRLRAARRGASVEEEVRTILRAVAASDLSIDAIAKASQDGNATGAWDGIRRLREKYGSFELDPPERSAIAGERPVFD